MLHHGKLLMGLLLLQFGFQSMLVQLGEKFILDSNMLFLGKKGINFFRLKVFFGGVK